MVSYEDIATTAAKAVLMILRVGPESYNKDVLNSEFGPRRLAPAHMHDATFETIAAKVAGPGKDASDGVFYVTMEIDSTKFHIEAHTKVVVNTSRIHGALEPIIFVHEHLDHRGHPYYIIRNASVRNGKITLWSESQGFDFQAVLSTIEAEMPDVQLV